MPSLAGSSIWQLPQVSPAGLRWIWRTSFSVSPLHTFFKSFTTKYFYRTRNDSTGIRFEKECLSQPFATLPCLLGRFLDTFLHLRQRLRRLLEFQCFRVPHSLYVYLCLSSSSLIVVPLVRHQYPFVYDPILWLQDYHAHQDLETYRNGLRYCQSRLDDDHEFSIDDPPFFFFNRASLLWKKPKYQRSHQRTSGSVLQTSFSERVLC